MASIGKQYAPNEENCFSNTSVVFKGQNYRITVLTERLLRLEYSFEGVFKDNQTILVKNRNFDVPIFKVEQDEKYLVIKTKYFMLQYLKEKSFLGPKFAPDSNLKVMLNNTDKMWYYSHPEARNFKTTGISLDDFTQNKYKLVKGLYSTDGFVTIDDSTNLYLDNQGYIKENTNKKNIDIYLFMYKRDFGLCLKDYFTLTGYPPLIPRYALGIWWNRDRIYSFDDTKRLVASFNKNQIPLSVLLLSEFWHIKDEKNYNLYKSGYTFNEKLFPNPKEFTDYMHAQNIRVGLNIDPNEGIRKEESCYEEFSNELAKMPNGNIPFNALDRVFMSLYVENIIAVLLKQGIDFFWIDYKHSLKSLQSLNYYHLNYYNDKNTRPLVLSRNSLVATHLYPVHYSGETIVSWETLKYLPFFNNLACNKGISWWSHDVGGFKEGIEDNELYLRYVEYSCFCPIFRFSAKRGPFYKREPWLWDIKTFTIAREYCLLRQRLIPYIYTEAYNYSKNGQPLIQPIYYMYPEIYDEPDYKNEYFFGRNLFISPITKPMDVIMNRSVERVFLPKGIWFDFKTGKKFIGNKRYVVFYKSQDYPVFVKAGAVIPLANLENVKNDMKPPKSLELNIFPGKSKVYELYEDDGLTNNYKKGDFVITAFDYNYLQNNYTLIIRRIAGKDGIIPALRDYKIRFRNTRKADNIEVYINGEKAKVELESYVDENDFILEMKNIATDKQVTINCKGKDIEINAVRIINEDINSILTDLKIPTKLKEEIAAIMFSNKEIRLKRIEIKRLKGLNRKFTSLFVKLLEYIAKI